MLLIRFKKFLNPSSSTSLNYKSLRIKFRLDPCYGTSSNCQFLGGSALRQVHSKSNSKPELNSFLNKLKDRELFRSSALINGEWVSTPSSEKFEVTDPAEGLSFASVPDLGPNEANLAIQAAHTAFADSEWSESTARTRHDLLFKLHSLMLSNQDDLATIITKENGKPLKESVAEVNYAASFVEWFAEEALRVYGDVIPSSSKSTRYLVVRQPVGVAGIITPWNFPLAMLTRKVAAALAAGCTVVVKPASETPLTALAFAELTRRCGFPKGVINILTTSSYTKALGEVFCTHPLITKISFTGSTAVGKLLMKASSGTMKRLSLELGGNAPFMVFDGADLDAAVEGLVASKFRNSGQTCVCPNRVYVQRPVHDEFVAQLTRRLAKLRVGPGLDPSSSVGPLIHAKAKEKVMRFVDDATSKAAKVVYGGEPLVVGDLKGYFYAPTVLTSMDRTMAAHDEEIFGPLVAVYQFDSEAEGLQLANDTPFGLAAYAYTRDLGRAIRVAEKLQAGMVAINSGSVSTATAPFGGVKESGLGREGSKYGIDEYTEVKFISLSF